MRENPHVNIIPPNAPGATERRFGITSNLQSKTPHDLPVGASGILGAVVEHIFQKQIF